MHDFLLQIQKAIDSHSYYLALYVSLTLPDICAAMQSENGQTKGRKYINWFNCYVAGKYMVAGKPSLDGAICYSYRCALLHQGRAQHQDLGYSRILFVEPGCTTNVFHNNILNDALNIDVQIFCNDIIEGANNWILEMEESQNPHYLKNKEEFMQRHEDGLPPYILGVPVIS